MSAAVGNLARRRRSLCQKLRISCSIPDETIHFGWLFWGRRVDPKVNTPIPEMDSAAVTTFGPFTLDVADERLCRGGEAIALRPKTFAVLRCLVERANRLVTKQQLIEHVWEGTRVSDTVLKVCIRELRVALGDSPVEPRFIQTAHRRGYRFIAALRNAGVSW
jgi:DNA-binding winged helix-turn-helix (wHTH) protein